MVKEQKNAKSRHVFLATIISVCMVIAMCPISAYGETAAEVKAQADEMMQNLDALQTQINEAQANYDTAVAAYNTAEAAMADAQARIDAAEQRIKDNQQKLKERAVAIYRSGDISMVDVLLGSTSFTDFVTTSNMVQTVNEYNASIVEESKDAKAEAQAARDEYQKQKTEAETQMQAAQDAKDELTTKAAEMESSIASLTSEAAELQSQEDAAAEEAKKAQEAAAIWQSSKGYTSGDDVVVGNGQFTHPCPGYSSISSTFGYRTFDNSFHKGVDFAASQGTPIYAADAGTVLIAGYSSSAGNWVVISHGNGLVTKYMHMAQTPFVSAGQTVTRGQNIGVVGTTGNSTGPHLHFQVEVNGTAVNPMYYL